ncbi:site-2 protease family protein [Streptomyces ovatisporus]|uniref:Site-2 protease family protein n=1 Tax=Streptomyces ovatisporus TaxID=1128682 RepID=A0ABV9AE34_9ACTN
MDRVPDRPDSRTQPDGKPESDVPPGPASGTGDEGTGSPGTGTGAGPDEDPTAQGTGTGTGTESDPPPGPAAEHPQAPRPESGRSQRATPLATDKVRRNGPFGGGILMGRPFGVPVYVAPSWFLVAALITWVFGGQLDRVLPQLGALRYLIALFFAVAFYASVLVHELAHTVVALRFKLPVRRIQLQFFGGVSEIEKEAENPGREFWLAFVGPLLSLVLAALFYGGMQVVRPGTVPGVLLAGLMISNLIVAVFNLLPGLPLDGGRMLRALVWKFSGRPMTGTVFAAWTGRALAVAVLIGLPLATYAGGFTQQSIGGVDSLMDALLAAILAAIIWTGAGNSLRMARLREHLPDLRARALTRRAVPVTADTPLSEALRRANEAGARALVVVDGLGAPLSLVREAAIAGIPGHRRPWVAVSTLAQDLKEGMRVPAELAGEELLEYLRATPATEYLVVEETGEIYGVLATGDVERAFVAAMAKPSA